MVDGTRVIEQMLSGELIVERRSATADVRKLFSSVREFKIRVTRLIVRNHYDGRYLPNAYFLNAEVSIRINHDLRGC